jgi:hypothetical protein
MLQIEDLHVEVGGKEVLKGRASLLDYYVIDRWIGGTHLSKGHIWCWDAVDGCLVLR